MRRIILLSIVAAAMLTASAQKPRQIDETQFTKSISDWSKGYSSWQYKGKRPAVIDFYADWCGPCRKIEPSIDSLCTAYKGKVDFYKVNIDKCPELAKRLSIRSIPMLLLCPVKGSPQAIIGVYPGSEIDAAMKYVLFPK
ncbi:MAG: thioredoxin domain-containing protein [Pseudoflavonifractor sp.]|nr:thioredoxin domain-containing protein [Pseudoflavonifractor sp.]